MLRYFIIHKPYMVLSQFSPSEGKKTLKDFFPVPADVYPVGRLDFDSEGLLLLTNDKELNNRLLNPVFHHAREYWAQVEGSVHSDALSKLQSGVPINVGGKLYTTKKCTAVVFENPPAVPPRNSPIRFRKDIPTTWIRIILTEGKNRQVRKMTAAVGHPTLRLIRIRIEQLSIDDLRPGEMKEINRLETYSKLFDKRNP